MLTEDVLDVDAAPFVSTEFFAADRIDPPYRPGEPLDVAPLTSAEIPDVVKLHNECFSGYLLTGLGDSFLRRYYGEFAHHAGSIGAVVRGRQSGRLVSFALGTSDAAGVFRSFYRRNLAAIVPITLARSIVSPDVRRHLFGVTRQIPHAMRLLLGGGQRTVIGQPAVRLLSIATAPPYRGSGASVMSLEAFEQQARDAGHASVGASCKLWNDRLGRFLTSHQWRESMRNDKGIWFERELP